MASRRITIGGPIKDAVTRDLVQALSTLGYYAILKAYGQRSFNNRSRNLHDSYASAVYVNGDLVEKSIKHFGSYSRKVDHRTKLTGRETAERYLRSNHFGAAKNEIVVVAIAAMHYAGILESGYFGSKYTVIYPAKEYIENGWWAAVYKVYDKYGLHGMPNHRVISGRKLL